MAQFQEMRISEKSSDPVKISHSHGDDLQQQPWPRPSAPGTISTTTTQGSDYQHHGEDEIDHPHKKSVLQKVKDKAKKLIKKKKNPVHGRDEHHREEECHRNFEEEEDEEEEDETEEEEEEKAGDFSPAIFHSRPVDNASAVSPGLEAVSARSLLKDSELAMDPVAPKTGVQGTSRDRNVVAGGAASDYRATSPAETARRQQEVPAALGQASAGITPILESRENAYSSNARDPDYDVQRSDGYSEKSLAHQFHDLGFADHTGVPAIQTEFPQQLPNYNRRKEAPENVLHGQHEPERIAYSGLLGKSPTPPEGIMKQAIAEEPATEKLIQRAGEVCGFDTNNGDIAADVEAGSRTVKDKNPSATHGGWEESGPTASISHELKSAEDNENAGRSPALEAATYVVETAVGTAQGLKDRIAMGLGGKGTHGNENDLKERENEEGVGHDTSYTEKILGMTSAAKNAIAYKLGYGEHQPVDQDRTAEEDNYENREEGKSYGDKIYGTASAAKNVISSKLGYGEHPVTVQEEAEAEKRRYLSSADHDEGAHEERGKSFTDKVYDTASAANGVVSSKLGYGRQEDHAVEEKPEGQRMENYEDDQQIKSDEHNTGEGKRYTEKIYETATTAKNAISSKLGYGGEDNEQQIDEVRQSESNAHPLSYTN